MCVLQQEQWSWCPDGSHSTVGKRACDGSRIILPAAWWSVVDRWVLESLQVVQWSRCRLWQCSGCGFYRSEMRSLFKQHETSNSDCWSQLWWEPLVRLNHTDEGEVSYKAPPCCRIFDNDSQHSQPISVSNLFKRIETNHRGFWTLPSRPDLSVISHTQALQWSFCGCSANCFTWDQRRDFPFWMDKNPQRQLSHPFLHFSTGSPYFTSLNYKAPCEDD